MEGWDIGYVDTLGPGHIRFDEEGGFIAFGCVEIGLDCSHRRAVVHFTSQGSDEGSEVWGDGDAELEPDGTISGDIRFHNGDDMPFTAKRPDQPSASNRQP